MIFYFSATGNCLHVARTLASAAGDELCAIPPCLSENRLSFSFASGEAVGFVFPTYFWGLPSVVVEFLQKATFRLPPDAYVFLTMTYGTLTGGAASMAERLLREKGVRLSARFCVQMPDTWTPVFNLSDPTSVNRRLAKAEARLSAVADAVKNREHADAVKGMVPAWAAKLFYGTYQSARKTAHLHVEASCVGCGLCAKQCPVHAIEMRNGKPLWVTPQCAMCLGCLHRCPQFAIQYEGKTAKHGQYIYPKKG